MGKLLILLLVLTGCGEYNKTRFYPIPKLETTDISDNTNKPETCTVVQEINQATILCPDGTSAVITNGKDGKDGTNGVDGIDGRNGIDGTDGMDGNDGQAGEAGQDGQDGSDGMDGDDGMPGRDAEPCTVYELNSNWIRIECPDGTFQDIRKK